jgi:hypothetical protein
MPEGTAKAKDSKDVVAKYERILVALTETVGS